MYASSRYRRVYIVNDRRGICLSAEDCMYYVYTTSIYDHQCRNVKQLCTSLFPISS
ncbi:hypothetical protein BDY19DRAFT_980436 [Irpex rosettiformis]|uniref:Uncharacterized protein n=1 Tax=Irpex rosettiformis TaxID=378272 RepID=A0ACB8TM98_9APHY|nr:hypothetical protein BDY19DRAFT_980436 [Irpex rosettiformis]